MKTFRAFKYRIYPTVETQQRLAQFFGAKRWAFNHFLAENKQRFADKQKHLSAYDVNKQITQLKKLPDTAWLKQVDDWALKHASEYLTNVHSNFFNSVTGRSKRKSNVPTFKSKNSHQRQIGANPPQSLQTK